MFTSVSVTLYAKDVENIRIEKLLDDIHTMEIDDHTAIYFRGSAYEEFIKRITSEAARLEKKDEEITD